MSYINRQRLYYDSSGNRIVEKSHSFLGSIREKLLASKLAIYRVLFVLVMFGIAGAIERSY